MPDPYDNDDNHDPVAVARIYFQEEKLQHSSIMWGIVTHPFFWMSVGACALAASGMGIALIGMPLVCNSVVMEISIAVLSTCALWGAYTFCQRAPSNKPLIEENDVRGCEFSS